MLRYGMAVMMVALTGAASGADEPSAADLVKIAEALSGALVQVEYALQYDKGESPGMGDPSSYLRQTLEQPGYAWESFDQLVREERGAERGGLLLSPTRVLAPDVMLHPRFVKSITVRLGDQSVPAVPVAWPIVGAGVILDLAAPLASGDPLQFGPAADEPHYAVTYGLWEGTWRVQVKGVGQTVAIDLTGQQFMTVPNDALIVSEDGTPVGAALNGRLPLDGSWKGSPLDWPAVSAAQLETIRKRIERRAGHSLLRVSLGLRSPRTEASPFSEQFTSYAGMAGGSFGVGGDDNATEWHGLGVLLDEQLVMVLANFKPKKTARLESIQVHTANGDVVKAAFAGTLKDYGALIAELERPLSGEADLATAPVLELRDQLLVKARIKVHGEHRTSYYSRARISHFLKSWEGRIYPAVSSFNPFTQDFFYGGFNMGSGGTRQTTQSFFFSTDGALVALPVERRQKVTIEQPWQVSGMWGAGGLMTPAGHVAELLADWRDHIDPENRPLSEGEENRLAWLGAELQPMNPDLARLNNVSDQTNGGTTGALITYLYEGSPATEKGIEVGDILLRLHIEGHPKPLEVRLAAANFGFEFPWQMLDQMPAQMFSMGQMPMPWGSVENELTRALTDVGVGTRYRAEIFRDGNVLEKDFVVEMGPPHYRSAPRFKSEHLGLTVRDLTYEVRRYFQMGADDPGVVISKIERGEKAEVAGLRPYEIIVSVDDRPLPNAEEFREAVAPPGDHRLFVKRMREGRTVKIRSEGEKDD